MRVPDPRSEHGFTLIEVLVAIVILLVGVLGVVAMVDTSNAVSARTKAREGANNVARSTVEVARAVPYRNLTAVELVDALASRPGLSDALPGAGHTISSRGFLYDVQLQVCSMDDPKDNLGLDDATVEFCPESDHATSAGNAKDRNPDDYKRVRVTLTWKRGAGSETVKQTSLISNPVGGLGPSVIRLEPQGLTGSPFTVTDPGINSLVFEAETSTNAAEVNWSVLGQPMGKADQIGASLRDWTFTWQINSPRYFYDCTYVVQAEANDDKGRAGAPKAVTVVLNRELPFAPADFEGGRNGNGSMVDLRWKPSPECDVLGYRVYRGPSATGPWTIVDCLGPNDDFHESTECIDQDAPASAPLWYRVVAVDTPPGGGSPREGAASPAIEMLEGNNPPNQPTGLNACLGGTAGCNEPDGTPASDTVTVLRWDPTSDPDGDPIHFYRIYRDGTSYADRVLEGIFFPGAGAIAWTDPDSPNGSHDYRVTAVDARFAESALSDPVVSFP
jgi:type IV pilus assembly protein PilV